MIIWSKNVSILFNSLLYNEITNKQKLDYSILKFHYGIKLKVELKYFLFHNHFYYILE